MCAKMHGIKKYETLQGIRKQKDRISSDCPDRSLSECRAAKSIHVRSNAGRNISVSAGEAMAPEGIKPLQEIQRCKYFGCVGDCHNDPHFRFCRDVRKAGNCITGYGWIP